MSSVKDLNMEESQKKVESGASDADGRTHSRHSLQAPQEQPCGFSEHRALRDSTRIPAKSFPLRNKSRSPAKSSPRRSRSRSPARRSARKGRRRSRERRSPRTDDERGSKRNSPSKPSTSHPEVPSNVTHSQHSPSRSAHHSSQRTPRSSPGQSSSAASSHVYKIPRKSRLLSFPWMSYLPYLASPEFRETLLRFPSRRSYEKRLEESTTASHPSTGFADQHMQHSHQTSSALEVSYQSGSAAESSETIQPIEEITHLDFYSSHHSRDFPHDLSIRPQVEHHRQSPRESEQDHAREYLPASPSSAPEDTLIDVLSQASYDDDGPPQRRETDSITDEGNCQDDPQMTPAVLEEVTKQTRLASVMRNRNFSSRLFQTPTMPEQKKYSWKELIYCAYQTLGVVYGDLGTSPLYVYPTIRLNKPTENDYLGILSVIFWTLTLVGVIKYTIIVLQADDHGEGGTFAAYSILCQCANIRQHRGDMNIIDDMKGRRISHFYNMVDQTQNRVKMFLERSGKAQQALLVVAMTATCMLIGDGILTPAISVVSAIEGIQTAVPDLGRAVILVISTLILILLFLVQRFGTQWVSRIFSPVMVAWFVTTPIVGVYNIVTHYPGIFKAFSPAHVVQFFRCNGITAWVPLGGTVLCITGAEAMYADMGHFNKRSIQIAFCIVVYPSVLLTYSGQTSYLIKHPDDHGEGFFKMIPKAVFWPMFVISTLAAIVASQGLISATFSVVKQSVALNYFPPVTVVHTSDQKEGQIYSPEVNYSLMVLCLAVLLGFRTSATIGNAFGVAVVFVMMITTCLMSVVMLIAWNLRTAIVMCFAMLFLIIEVTYVGAVITKFPQGGWMPFLVALVGTLVMYSWNLGCREKYAYEIRHQISRRRFLELLEDAGNVRVPGICFFFTDLMVGVPAIVQHYISNVRSLHRVLVFTTVRFLPVKTVLPSERFLVGRAGFDGVYQCVARYGYRDVMNYEKNEFLDHFLDTLKEYIESTASSTARKSVLSVDSVIPPARSAITAELEALERARIDGPVYVMGKCDLEVTEDTDLITRVIVGKVYRYLRDNCRSSRANMNIPVGQYLEVGMVYTVGSKNTNRCCC